jgi:hypothetical protein
VAQLSRHSAYQPNDPHQHPPGAYDAIADTLPLGSVGVEPEINDKGERLVWVDFGVANKLSAPCAALARAYPM